MTPRATEVYNLAVLYPEIAEEWHIRKNVELSPFDVTPSSGKKVWWNCQKGHEWEATINDRKKGSGCPYCSGTFVSLDYNLTVKHPELEGEWHPSKNGDLKPNQVTPGSDRKVWWVCIKGHGWEAARARPSTEWIIL